MRQQSMRIQFRYALPLLLIVAGCSKGDDNSDRRSKMTERERDSVLSESGLPGAKVVGRALSASDSELHHTIQLDSASQ
jgi:hypothetical protein